MEQTATKVIARLHGKTLATAESLTGGMIGSVLTGVPGASAVFKGSVVSYVNEVKQELLGVPPEILERYGAVSAWTAGYMASGVRRLVKTHYAVSVTGLAGPAGDEYGNSVGTVFIGFESDSRSFVKKYHFTGSREEIRRQTVKAALELILENI